MAGRKRRAWISRAPAPNRLAALAPGDPRSRSATDPSTATRVGQGPVAWPHRRRTAPRTTARPDAPLHAMMHGPLEEFVLGGLPWHGQPLEARLRPVQRRHLWHAPREGAWDFPSVDWRFSRGPRDERSRSLARRAGGIRSVGPKQPRIQDPSGSGFRSQRTRASLPLGRGLALSDPPDRRTRLCPWFSQGPGLGADRRTRSCVRTSWPHGSRACPSWCSGRARRGPVGTWMAKAP